MPEKWTFKMLARWLVHEAGWLLKRRWKLVHVESVHDGELGTVPACGASWFIEFWEHESGECRQRRT